MDDKPDYNLLSEIMRNANMGWWEADLQSESYVCSEYISKLLGLKEDGFISFENFNKRILKEEQPHTTIHSFDNIQQTNEAVYLLNTTKGPVWMRSKICMQKKRGEGKQQGLRHSRSARWPIHVVRLTTVATTGTAFAQHLQKLAGGHRALQHARGADRSE